MRHLALVRAFLLVWVHLALVTATHPQALHALAQRWIDDGHRFWRHPNAEQTRIAAEFVALAASILTAAGIIRTNDQVKTTFKAVVKGRNRTISGAAQAAYAERKASGAEQAYQAKAYFERKASGVQKAYQAKANAKLKEERRQQREKTLLENPDLAPEVLSKEEIASWCEEWLGTPFPRLNSAGEKLTWKTAISSGDWAIYFGTTRRQLKEEWLGFLTTRGLPQGGRNRPILQRANGTRFTPKQAERELGFFCVEVGVGDLLHHTCRGKEDYLQTHQTCATADIDEYNVPHRRLGQQLHREISKGSIKQEPGDHMYRVFATVAPITKHYFVPLDNRNRRTIWLNNVECRVVY
mmetsp:Transcript_363/g.1397  ORF Transcript_363/g.1397 Transcript_363/m.1397 type:complete len:353 (-) Transcript_363:50-1108(-)